MKLIVQIPCFNEEQTLPNTLADIPRKIPGIDEIEILVIDDGSTDKTSLVAREQGANHVRTSSCNRGLAHAYRVGVETALSLGADIIVNTDGDNQYCGSDIPKLVAPILKGDADLVIGARQFHLISHFSRSRILLQRLGSRLVRFVSGVSISDATSGFRAMTRDAALKLVVMSRYTYTLETIIQAARKDIRVHEVPIKTNIKNRESRLIQSVPNYVGRSALTILRVSLLYEPFLSFSIIGAALMSTGLLIGVRFLFFYFRGGGQGHIQSLVLAAILIILGFQTWVLGLLAHLLGVLRRFGEDTNYRIKKLESDLEHQKHSVGKPLQ